MKKYLNKIVLLAVFIFTLSACGGSGGSGSGSGSGKNVTYGTLAFSQTAVSLPQGSNKSITLTLSGSSNVTNLIATLTSSESTVASISTTQCTFSSNSTTTCQFNITANSNGTAQITATATYESNIYVVTPIAVVVTNSLDFSTSVQGIGETIYNHKPYTTTFVFTNNSSALVNLGQTAISMPSPIIWHLTHDGCSNNTVQSGGTCDISGNISILAPQTGATLSFTLTNSNDSTSSYYFEMNEYAVLDKPGYAAMHIHTPAGTTGQTGAYLLVDVGGGTSDSGAHPVQYTPSGNNIYVGTIITPSSAGGAPSEYTFQLPAGDTILYTPPMLVGTPPSNAGARMYVSYGGALSGAAGGMPDNTQTLPNVLSEFNVTQSLVTFLDVSYVNSVGVPISVTGVQQGSTLTNTSAGVKSQYYDLSGTTILGQIQSSLSTFPGTWDISAYFQIGTNNNLIAVLAPVSVFTSSSVMPAGFESSIFNAYFNDVWNNYYGAGHSFLINAIEVSGNLSGGSNCILSGSVIGSNMTFAPTSGSTCPTGTYTTSGGAFTTGPNTFSIPVADLGYYAFFSGFSDQSIYGVNGTYKSLVKYMAGAWTVGFLPFCGHDNIEYTQGALSSYSDEFFTPQYATCLPGYGSSYTNNVLNQYDNEIHKYFDSYGYAYDDTIGISATFNTDSTVYPITVHVLKYTN